MSNYQLKRTSFAIARITDKECFDGLTADRCGP